MTQYLLPPEVEARPRLSPHDELVHELRALRACILDLYSAIATDYNYRLARAECQQVYNPHPRQTLTSGATAKFVVSAPGTWWYISVEQSSLTVALSVHFGTDRAMGVLAILGSGDRARFPAASDILVLENTGSNTVGFSIVETNLGEVEVTH
jgi:hypothetical protein